MSSLVRMPGLSATEPVANAKSSLTYEQIKSGDFAKRLYSPSPSKYLTHWFVSMDVLALVIGLCSAWGLAEFVNTVFFNRSLTAFSGESCQAPYNWSSLRVSV